MDDVLRFLSSGAEVAEERSDDPFRGGVRGRERGRTLAPKYIALYA
jgi:hypothetical protein